MTAKRRSCWCFCGDVAGNVSTFPALPSIQPAEGAAQFGDAVFVVTAAMREDDAFRLPGEDVRQRGTGGGFIFEGGAPVGRGFYRPDRPMPAEFHHAPPRNGWGI